jgi:hypothetical protein
MAKRTSLGWLLHDREREFADRMTGSLGRHRAERGDPARAGGHMFGRIVPAGSQSEPERPAAGR